MSLEGPSAGAETVETSTGRLRGTRSGGTSAFLKIPFAAPPTGALRFVPPADPVPWAGMREPSGYGPAPPQVVDPLSRMLGLDFPGPTDEDCLHVNVWTPAADAGRRPVLVWLHGGAFATGSGTSPAYAGAALAARGDVVVVTFNYRVGAFGFLPFGSSHANVGLLDQIAALQWVSREIAGFGGDPTSVTVFGESAGAGSIVALLAMPTAKGLFRRAIIQSPAPDGVLSRDEGTERARMLAERLGDSSPGSASPARILEAQQECVAAGPHRTGMFFAPVIDGGSLPQRPLDAIAQGVARDVDILIGTTQEEMQLYSTIPGLGDFPDEILVQVVGSRLEGDESARDALAARAVALYREELRPTTQQELFFALETDLSLRVPSTRLAASQAVLQQGTYMYSFQWRSPMPNGQGGTLGACHALDLPFTFGNLEPGAARSFATGDREDLLGPALTLSGNIMDSWIAFARTGNPSHPGVGAWPRYDARDRSTMLLGEVCRVVSAPFEARRAVWED